jgi:hypothetical protein
LTNKARGSFKRTSSWRSGRHPSATARGPAASCGGAGQRLDDLQGDQASGAEPKILEGRLAGDGRRRDRREEVGVLKDECLTNTSLSPLWAYSPKGERARCKVPRNYGPNVLPCSGQHDVRRDGSVPGSGGLNQPVRSSRPISRVPLRKAGSRTRETLLEAMDAALDAITARNARGFFVHRGYPAVGPLL